MMHPSFAHSLRPRTALAVATVAVPMLLLGDSHPLAAQSVARAARSALRPEISVPLSVLVKIGAGSGVVRGAAGTVLGSVLRLPRRAPSGTKSGSTSGTKSGAKSGSTAASSTTTPTSTASTSGTAAGSATAARVLGTADRYVGTPYVFGGTTPDGFDCSGFVQYVYRKHGVAVPRTAAQQGGAGHKVRAAVSELRPGDLMLFDASSKRPGIDHVAMYVGHGRMIHSSSSGGGVGYDDLTTKRGKWFVDHMVAARRVASNGQSLVDALQSWAPALLDPPDEAPSPSIGKR